MQIELDIPDYTSLAKRAAKLGVSLDVRKHTGPIDVVVDSTGLKVFGEGEWKMRKHGKSKRRTWRKLHLAVNPDTQEIEAETLTENSCDDASQVDDLLDQVTGKIDAILRRRRLRQMEGLRNAGETRDQGDYSAAAEREDLAARQFAQPSVVAGRGDPRNPPSGPPAMEGRRRLPSSQPFGNGHVSDEVLLWRPSEKPIDPKSTNRNSTTKQNPQQVHPPRTSRSSSGISQQDLSSLSLSTFVSFVCFVVFHPATTKTSSHCFTGRGVGQAATAERASYGVLIKKSGIFWQGLPDFVGHPEMDRHVVDHVVRKAHPW